MPDRVTILSSRRAYEFAPDAIRLTMLTTIEVQRVIRDAFGFHQSTVGTPMETFGPVPPTLPPGVVFDNGSMVTEGEQIVPIRFLIFESQRIVVDVAASSDTIDMFWSHLIEITAGLQAPDGNPVIGTPTRTLDYSQISAHLQFRYESLLPQPLINVEKGLASHFPDSASWSFIPSISLTFSQTGGAFSSTPQHRIFRLEPRAGERIDAQIYFSSAPFPSRSHLWYLEQIESGLSGSNSSA